jgi:predicted naringenin-chalcone synthase
MSSASIMFILRDLLRENADSVDPQPGRAMAFGPGLTVETMDFTCLPAAAALSDSARQDAVLAM